MSMANPLVERWRDIIVGPEKSWVLFKNGTCVILVEPEADLVAQAIALMKAWGPVRAGSSAGDFSVIALANAPGWVVTCHHKDILTYVDPDEVESRETSDLVIGLLGRSKRDRDAEDLEILHVEDKRAGARDPGSPESCRCFAAPSNNLSVVRELGMDMRSAEVSVLVCRDCGQYWLRYFYEVEAFTASGRWYLGAISPEQASSFSPDDAKGTLERLRWYYYGGSYYEGRSGKASGEILLNP